MFSVIQSLVNKHSRCLLISCTEALALYHLNFSSGLHDEAYTKDVEKLFPQFHSNLHGNLDSGILTERPPRLQLSPGGILADEMGLGKTVEVCVPSLEIIALTKYFLIYCNKVYSSGCYDKYTSLQYVVIRNRPVVN